MKKYFLLVMLIFSKNSIAMFIEDSTTIESPAKKPVKILEINENKLTDNVWPGMTIKQAIQILGEPEETFPVSDDCGSNPNTSDSDRAIRYGVYWIIPPYRRNHVLCIVHQKGIKTTRGHICGCRYVIKKYIISHQESK